MKKFKLVLALLLALILTISMISCGSDSGSSSGSDSADTTKETEKTCTVNYENTTMSSTKVTEGDTISEPEEPSKSNYVFTGWYLDPDFTQVATFPLTINANTSLYAHFLSYKEVFAKARENTIGDAIQGYSFDYTFNVTGAYKTYEISGQTVGSSQYSTTGDITFYDEHTNSGTLFYDGTVYQVKKGNTLQKFSFNKNNKLVSYDVEQVPATFKFDGSSLAKALFEYTADQLKSVDSTSTNGEYKLNTSFNFSSGLALIGKYINYPIVEKLLGELPESGVNTGMYVTFEGETLKTYRYEMNISVSDLSLSIVYSLTFNHVDEAITITPKSFNNIVISSEDIATEIQNLNTVFNNYKTQTASGYDFKVTTGVDFGASNFAINSTFKGSAYRKWINDVAYFHNDIEIDSDLKNADLYKADNVADVHIKKSRIATGEVYMIEKKLLTDGVTEVENYVANETDSFYLYDILSNIGAIDCMQKDTVGSTTVYSLGVSTEGTIQLLNWLNTSLDLDPLERNTVGKAIVFGNYTTSSVEPKETEVVITITDNKLVSVEINAKGKFVTYYDGSRDFTTSASASYEFTFELEPQQDGETFVPYETAKAAK